MVIDGLENCFKCCIFFFLFLLPPLLINTQSCEIKSPPVSFSLSVSCVTHILCVFLNYFKIFILLTFAEKAEQRCCQQPQWYGQTDGSIYSSHRPRSCRAKERGREKRMLHLVHSVLELTAVPSEVRQVW